MMPKEKKAKLAESGEGEGSAHVNEELVRSISEIKNIQKELNKIKVEEDDKVLEVLQEYSELSREIYARRNEVSLTILDFWLTVLINHPILSEFLSVEDLKILRYLVSLDVEERPKLGYSITFNFSPNPYFENKKLTKTFSFPDQATAVITGATINWKEGSVSAEPSNYKWAGGEVIMHWSNPCFSKCFKHNANKSAHEAGQGNGRHELVYFSTSKTKREEIWKLRMSGENNESFFTWFSRSEQIPFSAAALDKVACTIKECLWPDPLKYIIDNKGLEGEGGVQNVDEEWGESDAGEVGLDDEIEQKGDEEDGEIVAEEGGQEDNEIEVQEQDEQVGQCDGVIEQEDDEEGRSS